jgi:hypothetical protein
MSGPQVRATNPTCASAHETLRLPQLARSWLVFFAGTATFVVEEILESDFLLGPGKSDAQAKGPNVEIAYRIPVHVYTQAYRMSSPRKAPHSRLHHLLTFCMYRKMTQGIYLLVLC